MNEWTLVWLTIPKVLSIFFFIMCYIIGGRKRKWIRRFLGGIGFGLSIFGISILASHINWWLLALPVAYPLALCMGYGADNLWAKLIKRTLYGVLFGLIGLYAGFMTANLYLGIAQLILPIIVSVSLGVFNPLKDAVTEETLIATSLVIHVPFMV